MIATNESEMWPAVMCTNKIIKSNNWTWDGSFFDFLSSYS